MKHTNKSGLSDCEPNGGAIKMLANFSRKLFHWPTLKLVDRSSPVRSERKRRKVRRRPQTPTPTPTRSMSMSTSTTSTENGDVVSMTTCFALPLTRMRKNVRRIQRNRVASRMRFDFKNGDSGLPLFRCSRLGASVDRRA